MYADTILGHLIMHSTLKLIGGFYTKGSLKLMLKRIFRKSQVKILINALILVILILD